MTGDFQAISLVRFSRHQQTHGHKAVMRELPHLALCRVSRDPISDVGLGHTRDPPSGLLTGRANGLGIVSGLLPDGCSWNESAMTSHVVTAPKVHLICRRFCDDTDLVTNLVT